MFQAVKAVMSWVRETEPELGEFRHLIDIKSVPFVGGEDETQKEETEIVTKAAGSGRTRTIDVNTLGDAEKWKEGLSRFGYVVTQFDFNDSGIVLAHATKDGNAQQITQEIYKTLTGISSS